MKRKLQTSGGFTLIEMLVVVGIVGIVSTMATISYLRDTSRDNLLRAATQVTSILRGASVAGMSVGRTVIVKIDDAATYDIVVWVDEDYNRSYDAGEVYLSQWDNPYSDVKLEYVKIGALGTSQMDFTHRGDVRYDQSGAGVPNYDSFDGMFLRLSTGPTTPPTTDDSQWYSFTLHSRTGYIEVADKYVP